eukprot:s4986_g3.t1
MSADGPHPNWAEVQLRCPTSVAQDRELVTVILVWLGPCWKCLQEVDKASLRDLFLHLRRSEVSSRCGVARTDPDKSCMSSVDSMQEVVGYGKPESASPTPIEVSRVSSDGSLQTVYRVPIASACSNLSFCYKSSAHLLCSCSEGLQLVFNLLTSETSCAYDNPEITSLACSSLNLSPRRTTSLKSTRFRLPRPPPLEVLAPL